MTSSRADRPTGLGRGLAALIPQRAPQASGSTEIPLDRIQANPRQPRLRMDDAALTTLAASIREHGVIQPILVTESVDGYQLVAGERRVRAARMAGLDRIPAVIRQLADREQLELALVENLQREDLDPLESARAYRQLIDDFGFSQEALAARVGRARSTVANTLRLLDLHTAVQAAVADGTITEGHGRAIGGLAIDRQPTVVAAVIAQDLSVRQTEEFVRRLREPREPSQPAPSRDVDAERVEEDLRRALGTKVRLARARTGGRIVIDYYSEEELGRLYERLMGGTA
ncbi:MAG: ParB/RepB/Spo0J family partition protein [Chloroflexi bacterium]|nr:ParB/RepB/Spo0J family partition protein [Chloroflexota bacterium]